MAVEAAMLKSDNNRNYYIGCVGIRSDGVVVKGRNQSSNRILAANYKMPNRQAHAEYRVAQKLNYDAEVFVARVRLNDGDWGMARPCDLCMKILRTRKVRRVCYTIAPQEYGVLYL
jgi:pyrimidine deaminase RibD-like protein